MRKYVIYAFVLLLMLPFTIQAQRNYSFKHINSELGLSSSCVKSILQDSFGFMWFGTKNGLNRYDGFTIKEYVCYDAVSKRGNNNIGALYEDAKRNLWVGTDRGVYIYNPYKETFTFVATKSVDGISADNWVEEIKGDNKGRIWVLVPDQGVFCYYNGEVKHYNCVIDDAHTVVPISLYVNSHNDVFVGTLGNGALFRYNDINDRFVPMTISGDFAKKFFQNDLQIIREQVDGNLVLCAQNGEIGRLNLQNNALIKIPFSAAQKIYLRDVACVDDEIWIGTQSGLYVIDEGDNTEVFLRENKVNAAGLSDNLIYTMAVDRNGGMWLGTAFSGVSYCQRKGFIFDKYAFGGISGSLSSKRIRGLAQSSDGNIWIGTEEAGLNILNPRTGVITQRKDTKDRITLIVESFGDKVYAGFSRMGLDVINVKGKSANICSDLQGESNSVYSVLCDKQGNEWIGLDYGLYYRKAEEKYFTQVEGINGWIFDLFEANDGKIWVASMGMGVYVYDPVTTIWKPYPYDETHSNGLRTNSIGSIMQDSKGTIWLSSDRGGLIRYNADTDDFTSFGMAEGLPDDVVYNILEDRNGYLWFGTNRGLVKFNPFTHDVKIFTTREGLPGNQFNYHAAIEGTDGNFYFGGVEGLIAFNPLLDVQQDSIAPIYFTRLRVLNEDVVVSEKGSPLKDNILFSERVELSHDQSTFSLSVASPNYTVQSAAQYTYRMYPIANEWVSIDANQTISFANLAQGNYRLDVKVASNGAESMRSIYISILPPWYNTVWAKILYLFICIAAVVGWFVWYRNHKEKQLCEKQELFTVKKEKELFESKVQFFTEVAHEIRTPLTLIGTPLEAIEEMEVHDTQMKRYLTMMRQNVNRLLDLTGQLLDFQKLGASRLRLKYENVDITSLLTKTLNRFEPAITLNNKVLVRNIPMTPIVASVDREAITKIISNLLNNALKYARRTIIVELLSDADHFKVRVISDSDKLSREEAERIFEPFYQKDNKEANGGVGIGLPLSRQLAEAHHGSISLEKDDNPDNAFVLEIPINSEGIVSHNESSVKTEDYATDTDSNQSVNTPGYTLMLVEDNDSLREFLVEQLSYSFAVETARNGREALEKMEENHFDLIVTDIMMPEMDGFELCTAVKDNIDLSHIPVIFLTAKHDLESKLRGLKCGGEAFIEKPFSIKFFKQQILSLLDNRRREREAFLKKPFVTVDTMKMNKADEEFMNKVITIIGDNICNDNFSVESMAELFCMSRSSLLRKIKTLFNLSPVELIRLVRLKKAAELIQEGKYRIGDVCYMVGINSLSYFSKLFFKQFGITPKDFEKQCQKNTQIILTTKSDEPTNETK
ncbi:MAG: response regulator [Coprobacter sp.]|nr:response regulator [Coprobacter sp.]